MSVYSSRPTQTVEVIVPTSPKVAKITCVIQPTSRGHVSLTITLSGHQKVKVVNKRKVDEDEEGDADDDEDEDVEGEEDVESNKTEDDSDNGGEDNGEEENSDDQEEDNPTLEATTTAHAHARAESHDSDDDMYTDEERLRYVPIVFDWHDRRADAGKVRNGEGGK